MNNMNIKDLIQILTGRAANGYRERTVPKEEFPEILGQERPDLYKLVTEHAQTNTPVAIRIEQSLDETTPEAFFELLKTSQPDGYEYLLEKATEQLNPPFKLDELKEKLPKTLSYTFNSVEDGKKVTYEGGVYGLWIDSGDVRASGIWLKKYTTETVEREVKKIRFFPPRREGSIVTETKKKLLWEFQEEDYGTFVTDGTTIRKRYRSWEYKSVVETAANNKGISLPRRLVDNIFDPIAKTALAYVDELRDEN